MILWSVFFLLALISVLGVLAPVFWRHRLPAESADSEMVVYRQQLLEIGGDLDAGILSAEEAGDARLEVERRLLRVSGRPQPASANQGGPKRYVPAVIVAVALPLGATSLYGWLGRPNLPAQPVAGRAASMAATVAAATTRAAPAAGAQQPDVGRMVKGLADRLADDPTDYEGWLLLGRSMNVLNRYDEAADAYRRATRLPEAAQDATPHSGLGESLVFGADGRVTPAAKANFEIALGIDPADPGGRYYLADALAQAGDLQAAYDGWLDLARTAPPGVPWMPSLRRRLQAVADQLGVDLSLALPERGAAQPAPKSPPRAAPRSAPAQAPGPTEEDVAAAGQMSSGERQSMIRGMVGRLANRLAEEPDDHAGWLRLGKSYGVLGERQKAAEAYGRAAALAPNDVATLMALANASLAASGGVGGGGAMPAKVAALYRRILSLDPNNAQALWFTGLAAAEAGDHLAAAKHWQVLLTRIPADAPQYQQIKRRIDALLESAKE